MAIKYWVAGCSNEPANADKEMSDIKTWDNMVWHAYHNAHLRYCHWKEGHFKSGAMQQIYLAEVEVDIFDPANSKVVILMSDAHPYQKTVVYNKNEELDSLKKAAPTTVVTKNVNKSFGNLTSYLTNNPYEDIPWPTTAPAPQVDFGVEPDWNGIYNNLHNQGNT